MLPIVPSSPNRWNAAKDSYERQEEVSFMGQKAFVIQHLSHHPFY
jgi:hypothetical protein